MPSHRNNLIPFRISASVRPRVRRADYALALCLIAGFLCGCSGKNKTWYQRKTSKDYVDLALESPNPDERREGVNGLSNSADAATDWAVKVFDTIARTDSNTAVRCAAVRAMHRSAGPRHLPTLLKILRSASQRLDDVRPAPGPLRWEAARLLTLIVGGHSYEGSQRDELIRVLRERATDDRDRNVRLALIEALGFFHDRTVLETLITLLQDEDFAITRAAEQSLIALTGVTHRHNSDAWRTWLAQTTDPFERTGHIPAEARVESKSNWSWDW